MPLVVNHLCLSTLEQTRTFAIGYRSLNVLDLHNDNDDSILRFSLFAIRIHRAAQALYDVG
jgi:hypothetical protein